ncbi:hypothetical protein SNEBB_008454 [Seison nebaliae]|nr:hypothetical protein SNEBB_008454 [Seison nebaliae]
MVCIPCLIYPALTFLWISFINPYIWPYIRPLFVSLGVLGEMKEAVEENRQPNNTDANRTDDETKKVK